MKPDQFQAQAPGRLIQLASEGSNYYGFIPNPLPPALAFDLPLIRLLSEADHALGELSGLGRALPNPHLLINPFIRREAVLSSRIEGTRSDLTDLYTFEAGQLSLPGLKSIPSESDVREVSNYVVALEYGVKRIVKLPVSLRLIRELHERLLLSLLLVNWNLIQSPLLYLSAYFEKHQDEYYDLLLSVSTNGSWKEWIGFFLEGVAEQACDAIDRAKRLQDLQVQWREKLHQARVSGIMLGIVDELFYSPVITPNQTAEHFHVSHQAAMQALRRFEQMGLLKEVTGKQRNRLYVASEILQILE